jgi:hypothetical protein
MGALDSVITYSADTRLFTMNAEDKALLEDAPYLYTVKSHLKDYPTYGVAVSDGTISFGNPCTSPEVEVGPNAEQDLSYDGVNSFAPDLTFEIAECAEEVVYTCRYVTGPYDGTEDLCDFV